MDNIPVEGLRKLEKKVRPQCRFCGKDCRALDNNGIIGPGYSEWNYVCNICGRVQ